MGERKRIRVDGVFDIECWAWSNFKVGVTMTADGDSEIHRSPGSMVDAMFRAGGVWWGHNSGGYDTLQVLEILRQRGVGQSISMSGSRVSRTMGGGLTIRDSYSLVPMGLEAFAEMAKRIVPRLWFECKCGNDCGGYCAIRKRMPYYMERRLEEYCVEDCATLLAGLRALSEFAEENDFDLCGTIGGSSWATAKRVIGIPDAEMSASQWTRIRSAYYGGRCSVFRPIVHASGSHWDICSAYPSALANTSLPTGPPRELGSRSAMAAMARDIPGIYSCTINVPDMHVPPLPWGWGKTGLSFPIGTVSGVWTLIEIQYAESLGCEVTGVEWAMVWDEDSTLFGEWIGKIYALRDYLGKDTAFGGWLRLFPNSLVGKMAERPDKRFLRLNPPISDIVACPATRPCTLESCSGVCGAWEQVDKWGEMWSVPFYRHSESGHIQWAAYVNAASRITHRNGIDGAGTDAIYAHTDSLWTTRPEPPMPSGHGLGQWSLKCRWSEWESPALQSYAYTDEKTGERITHSAGIMISPAEWEKGMASQDRGVMSVIEAARRGNGLFSRAHRKWTLPEHGSWYGDRILGVDGITRPVTCGQLRTRLNERANRTRKDY